MVRKKKNPKTYWEFLETFVVYDYKVFYIANFQSWTWACIWTAWEWDDEIAKAILEEKGFATFFTNKKEALEYVINFFKNEFDNNSNNDFFWKYLNKIKLDYRKEFWIKIF
jgi:hypothetical protein